MKNNVQFLVIIFIFIGISFFSCASQLTNSPKINFSSPNEVISSYNKYFQNFKTFEAEGRFSIITPQNRNTSLRITTYIKYPDSLRIKIEGPLGMDGVSLFVDDTDYLFYNHRDKYSEKGKLNNLDFASMLHDSIDINIEESATYLNDIKDELFAFFSGLTKLNSENYLIENPEDLKRKENVFVSSINKTEIIKFPINKTDLNKVQISDSNGDITIEKEFKNYMTYGNVRFPRFIRYIFKKENSRFRIFYQSFRVNKDISDDKFIIKIK